ncbi:hypothetical protein TSAR_006967 [Trichomalopsis sarcophagae]|uniref:Single domain-containing protein n=1 Tax=Trichomalopsis sarcophagae TaxID=543379 RepID=A0A232FBZ9_9HYME|nr:hypothetical protein TSAR_006967 [Trichomalopsis sarcophagae]
MKYFVAFCIVVLAVVFASSEDEFRAEYCKDVPRGECIGYKCSKDGSKISAVACAESRCKGETVGFKENENVPYPQCCPEPICK